MKLTQKLFLALAMLGGVACTTNTLDEGVVENNEISRELPKEIKVSFDDATSRIQLDEQCRTTWTEDDELSVFYFSDANNQFLFMGDTGDRNGALVVEENRMSEATAEIDKIVLVYPYSDDYKLNATTKSIGVTIPGTQYYLNGSYGVGANIMTSVGTSNDFALKSVCGWIKVQLTGAATVTEVTLTGNSKEQLAGDATLYYEENRLALLGEEGGPDDSSQVGGTLFFGEYVRTITLDCGEGIALDSTTPTEFYFVLAPQTFDEGITITATLSDGTTITKSTSNSITVERNIIVPMAAFDVQPTNEIWYTSTDGNIVEPYNANGFGANIVSNTYENGKGVIKFDGDVTQIGYHAFYGCCTLKNISIPTIVSEIGEVSFQRCSNLIDITIPNSIKVIDTCAFDECQSLSKVVIPSSVVAIGCNIFRGCSNLSEINGKFTSEDGRCLIDDDGVLTSFAPAGLTEYTIPKGTILIAEYAFFDCPNLTQINIPNGVEYIARYAFRGCSSLGTITIPNSVTSITYAAFSLCSNLSRFEGESATEDGRCLIVDNKLVGFAPAGLTEYVIPDYVTSIESSVFEGCTQLKSVTIPDGCNSIDGWVFYGCENLENINIPQGVASIEDSTFRKCSSLTSVTIPEGVTSIGDFAFARCTSLIEVYCEPTTPPSGSSYMFAYNASDLKIYVPTESVDAYKSADGWSEYADAIVGYEF